MKKTILTGLISLMLISVAYSISIGDTYTQQQLNNVNAESIGLQPALDNLYFDTDYLIIEYSHFDLEKDGDIYRVIDRKADVRLRKQWLNSCVATHGRSVCLNALRRFVISQVKSSMQNVREQIVYYQQPSTDLTLENLGISGEDFN